jgi:hypothetical protein
MLFVFLPMNKLAIQGKELGEDVDENNYDNLENQDTD